ncbi:MAG: tripartite tricarboxylate transporter substrate binding protein [Burkholderiales bacterium]|nr:tripartite tricarboxylate transporter substrate binding protein [Burkholderiales bacterium]
MKPSRKCRGAGFVILCALAALPALPVQAQGNYPARSLRIIVGFAPASSNDILSRFVGLRLSERLGQQVVVDNRPGANGIIGAQLAANANPDGHTLLLVTTSYTMNPAIHKLPFDPVKAFAPVTPLGSGPLALVASPSFAPNNVKDLIAFAKAKPGVVTYATAGVGGINHFGSELFARNAGIRLVHVPYKGGAPGLTDVMGGQVNIMFGSLPLTLPHIRSGKIKALGVSSAKRIAQLPAVPTVAEAGAPGYEMSIWWGLSATAGSPGSAITRLHQEVATILAEPEAAKRLNDLGAEPASMSVAEFSRFVSSEIDRWIRVAREANIKAD